MKIIARVLQGCLVLALMLGLSTAHADKIRNPRAKEIEKMRAAAPEKPTVAPKQARKILVFSAVPTGYVHSAIPYGAAAIQVIGEKTGAFEAVISDDMDLFMKGVIDQFDAIVFNNANNELFLPGDLDKLSGEDQAAAREKDAALKASLVDFIKGGKGVAVVHSSIAIFREWDEWGDIIGGRFDNHPWNDTVTVRVEEPDHPLVRAFKTPEFQIHDEIYQVKGPYSRETHRVLLTLDLEKSPKPKVADLHREDKDYALAWIKPYGEGRVFYSAFGHIHDLFWDTAQLQFLCDGIQFTIGDLEADMTPSR